MRESGRKTVQVVTAITAAGASHRMGRPKGLLCWSGSTFLDVMVSTLLSAGIESPIGVVIGADRDLVEPEVTRVGAVPLVNHDYERGRFSSVKIAASWARECAVEGSIRISLLLWPVDCPGVRAATLTRLIREGASHPDEVIVPTVGEQGGHPVVLGEPVLDRILTAPLDSNLRQVIRDSGSQRRLVEVDDPAVLDNLNDPDSVQAFLEREGSSCVEIDTDG